MNTFSQMADDWLRQHRIETVAQPEDAIISVSPGTEPPKPPKPTFDGFEGAIPRRMQIIYDVPLDCDPDAWRWEFSRWRSARCASRQGQEDSAGVACLWVDFSEWAVRRGGVPCTRATFERLLSEAGFRCVDGMAAGLLLLVDLEAVLCFQNPPAKAEPAPKRTRRAFR
jgi:hypothetical protein